MKTQYGIADTEKESIGGAHKKRKSKDSIANEFYKLGYQTMGLAAARMQFQKDQQDANSQLLEAQKQLMQLSAEHAQQVAQSQAALGAQAGAMAGAAMAPQGQQPPM